jgi:hypothetical protein
MIKKEANFNTTFNHWLKENPITGAFELKQALNGPLPYSALAEHQELALINAKHKALVFKIPDAGYQNPFDCFCLNKTPAFVVILYPSKKFYLIDIDNFIFYRDNRAKRKSLTEEEAQSIATKEIQL